MDSFLNCLKKGIKKMPKGRILKVIGGLFYVLDGNKLIRTTASGKLRDYKHVPIAGDIVCYESTNENEGYIKKIEPRKNKLVRPPVSNIDQAIIVTSLVEPDFSSLLLDKLLVQILDNNLMTQDYRITGQACYMDILGVFFACVCGFFFKSSFYLAALGLS